MGEDRLTIAKALLRNDYDRDRIISFLVFIKNFLYINDLKINSIFDQQLVQLTGGTINMGVVDILKKQERQQGLQQGAEQKSHEFLCNLIEQTNFDDAKIASLVGVTIAIVKKTRTELNEK